LPGTTWNATEKNQEQQGDTMLSASWEKHTEQGTAVR